MAGGWAVVMPEGQVRRRVVGEGLGEGMVLNFLEGEVEKRGNLDKNLRFNTRRGSKWQFFLRFEGKRGLFFIIRRLHSYTIKKGSTESCS